MSFGWSAGDAYAAVNLLWAVCRALHESKGAPAQHRRIEEQIAAIEIRLELANRRSLVWLESELPYVRRLDAELQATMDELKTLVEKGSGMHTGRKWQDWPSSLIKKIRWGQVQQAQAEKLVGGVDRLTRSIMEIHAEKLNDERYNEQEEHYEVQLLLLRRVQSGVENTSQMMQEMMTMFNLVLGALEIGPQNGFPRLRADVANDSPSSADDRASHFQSKRITYSIMSAQNAATSRNLKADHAVKQILGAWLQVGTPPRLWIHGPLAKDVSAILCDAMIRTSCPVIAFSCRHVTDDGAWLPQEQRLIRMVFSLLYQAQRLCNSNLAQDETVTGPPDSSADPTISIESVSSWLKSLAQLLDRLPRCVVVVDGWHHVAGEESDEVDELLRELLRLCTVRAFKNSPVQPRTRLLLTTRGPCRWLHNLPGSFVRSFNLSPHMNKGQTRLLTSLLEIDWT